MKGILSKWVHSFKSIFIIFILKTKEILIVMQHVLLTSKEI